MFETDERLGVADFDGGRLTTDDPYTRMPKAEGSDTPKAKNALDSEENEALHRRLVTMYEQEIDRQGENRAQMATDEDFYDNIQWTEEDARELRERGQDPLVFNVISSSVNWVLGTEKRGRTDYKILPRRKEDGKPAERKTELMKYLSDVNRTPFHRSRAFEDAAKVGLGWIETGVTDGDDGEPIYTRHESWRNILYDSASAEKDLSDCRYMFRTKWVDMDIAKSMFPDRFGLLQASAGDTDRYGLDQLGDDAMDGGEFSREMEGSTRTNFAEYSRTRVRLIEGWIRIPGKVKKLNRGQFKGDMYDEGNPGHREEVESGRAVVIEKNQMRMEVAIFCQMGMLYHEASPYRHNTFPFTPIWCYRRGRDNLPYGMIRGMRDLQYDINKRAAKALHILSTNKTIMDEGAVDDVDEYLEESSRPDAVIVVKQGKKLEMNADRDLAPAHLELMSRSISMIQTQSGVTDENMGRQTNATSGLAIGRRQEQGAMATAGIFDNLRFANQVAGEKELSLIEQYMGEEKQFRITNMRGVPSYVTINDGLPENDIVRTKADFIISDADWRNTMRQAATEQLMQVLMQLAPTAPQLAMVMLDLIVEEMDISNREELVKRIRQETGMSDPDQEEPTEEELAAQQAAQQAAEKQQQMNDAMFELELAEKQAKAQKLNADAAKAMAGTEQIMAALAGQNVETQRVALEAALAMITTPEAAPVADVVLQEAGFKGQSQLDAEAQQQQQEEQAAQEQAAMEEAAAQEQQQQAMEQEQLQAPQQPMPEQGEQMPPEGGEMAQGPQLG
ncbi:hypothetical protein SKUL_10 [Pseudomonas phage Skulduggery]|uniref:Portal protein n=1 Tax=Pseudomonas phage Skulduggery TaxID=2006671 RepID=A0A1Y0SZZ6_9CAUD|nr:portal protein [Pseudomonas phage Skulduggery]ARV77109.1 hypothetical protein SKUL_10 [Pseudomonas phage Skulduggery]